MSPFVSFLEPAVFKNNRSYLSHAKFVWKTIQDLVELGHVVESKAAPQVVNPLSISVEANRRRGPFLIQDTSTVFS